MFMPSIRRRTPETNFRPVEEDELVSGLELLYVEDAWIHHGMDPTVYAFKIRLDDKPIREKDSGRYTLYHIIDPPYWPDLQCFTSVEHMTEQSEPSEWQAHYW